MLALWSPWSRLLPHSVSFGDAVYLAGAVRQAQCRRYEFDWDNRYNLWSGLIGGTFLALAYFGCDQSQVQRYLTGKSVAQSKLSLLFNAMAKVPMQFFILFVGAMVFVFFTFEKPPLPVPSRWSWHACRKIRDFPQSSNGTTRRSRPSAPLPINMSQPSTQATQRDGRPASRSTVPLSSN